MSAYRCARVWLWIFYFSLGLLVNSATAQVPSPATNCIAVAISASGGNATLNVFWTDNSNNETGFRLQVSADADPTFVTLQENVAANSTGYPWTTALTNHVYRFRVIAKNGSGSAAPSNVATVSTSDLGIPFNLKATVADAFNVSLAWEEASTGEAGFALESRVAGGNWFYLGWLGANNLGVSPSALITPSTTYEFRMRAFKGSPPTTPGSAPSATVTAYSNVVSVVAPAYPLTATPVPCESKVTLTWPNILNEGGYRIYRRGPDDSDYGVVADVAANVTTYQVIGRPQDPGKVVTYVIQPFTGTSAAPSFLGNSDFPTAIMDGITSPLNYAAPVGYPFSYYIRFRCVNPVTNYAVSDLPSGLTINPTTGLISGTPTTAGTFSSVITLTHGSPASTYTATLSTRIYQFTPMAAAAPVGTTIPELSLVSGESVGAVALSSHFSDPDATSALRVVTDAGDMDFGLFGDVAPLTVANFINYVNRGDFVNTFFHRSIPGFVIQGGGYKATTPVSAVVTDPPVQNEYLRSNIGGTISMAKLGSDPNSATCQFFISLDDNSANLNNQNGGFTVFGRVAGSGMATAFAIASKPLRDWTAAPGSGVLTDVPVSLATDGDTYTAASLIKVQSVNSINPLTFTISDNTQPSVATASIVSGQLSVTPLASGTTTISVLATDLDNLTATQSVVVTVNDTFATWANRQNFASGQETEVQNPDGDLLNNLQEYAFLGDPKTNSLAEVPASGLLGAAPAAQFLTLTFPVRKLTSGLTYAVQTSTSLDSGWTTIWTSADGFSHAQVQSAVDATDRTTVTIKDTLPLTAGTKRFIRTKVTQN